MVSNDNKVRIILIGVIILMIFLSIGCLRTDSLKDKQLLNSIFGDNNS